MLPTLAHTALLLVFVGCKLTNIETVLLAKKSSFNVIREFIKPFGKINSAALVQRIPTRTFEEKNNGKGN
jgi:hypothetical protein